jgi:hypothetical protein
MTDEDTLWLQFVCSGACAKHLSLIGAGARRGERRYTAGEKNFVTAGAHVRSSSLKARRAQSKQQTLTMKRNLLTVVAAGAIALGGFVVVQAQAGPGGPGGHGHAFGLQGITKQLNLTSDQQTRDFSRSLIRPTANRRHPSGGDAENENRDGRLVIRRSVRY